MASSKSNEGFYRTIKVSLKHILKISGFLPQEELKIKLKSAGVIRISKKKKRKRITDAKKIKLQKKRIALRRKKIWDISNKTNNNSLYVQEQINLAVVKCHRIAFYSSLFMKHYLLDFFDRNQGKLPIITTDFILECMKAVCTPPDRGNPLEETLDLRKMLRSFYLSDFKPLLGTEEDLNYENLSQVLQYLSVDILKDYENQIRAHYIEHVHRYVNVAFDKQEEINKIMLKYLAESEVDQNKEINEFLNQLRKIKDDILDISPNFTYRSNPKHHSFVDGARRNITPNKPFYSENNLIYALKANPLDYLPSMIRIMRKLEEKGLKTSNVFPLRTAMQPKHIKIDTATLVNFLYDKKRLGIPKTKEYLRNHIRDCQDGIWNFFFNMKLPCFKKREYSFDHMIQTDGVACSILLIRDDMKDRTISKKSSSRNDEKYIDELSDYSQFLGKNIVAYDPGKCDLIYCVDGIFERDDQDQILIKPHEFRYSQNQRRKESKSKKFSKLEETFKAQMIDGKTVTQYETELSQRNRKTLIVSEFKKYISEKVRLNQKLWTFYEQYIFRKLKLNGYWNRQKSEDRMVENFKKIFGGPDRIIIVAGDHEQRKHLKHQEPTKGKGIRTIFRRHGYKLYLVDEYRTSCRCSKCGEECEKFMRKRNPRPYRTGEILVHGLLSCKNCGNVWNRDVNGATNIWKIANNAVTGKERPEYLKRGKKREDLPGIDPSKKNSLALDDAKNQNGNMRK